MYAITLVGLAKPISCLHFPYTSIVKKFFVCQLVKSNVIIRKVPSEHGQPVFHTVVNYNSM